MNEFKDKYLTKQRDKSSIAVRPKFPRIIKIDICNVCNYACVFCPQAIQTQKKGNIDDELCKKIIADAYKAGAREICLSATGEPMLNMNLEEYVAYAKELGYLYVFFNTNGFFLNTDRAKKLIVSGVDSIKVSVNSGKRSYEYIHGVDAYNLVLENIKKFDALRKQMNSACKLYVSYVMVPQTEDELDECRKEVEPFVDEFIWMKANNRGGSVTEYDSKIYYGCDEFSFKYPCSQLFNNVYVTAEGYMVICCQDFENLTVVADLNAENVADAWNNQKFSEFRERYLNHKLEGTLCNNCLYNTNTVVVPLNKEKAYYKISDEKVKNRYFRIEKLIDND